MSAPSISIDIGGTLAKLVVFIPRNHPNAEFGVGRFFAELTELAHVGVYEKDLDIETKQGTFYFIKFLTSELLVLEKLGIIKILAKNASKKSGIFATGGGAHKYASLLRNKCKLSVNRYDELGCLVHALKVMLRRTDGCFTLANARFRGDIGPDREKLLTVPVNIQPEKGVIVVNIGSGVSILHVKGKTYERIGGSSLGGSTFLGLVALLTGCDNFDEALDLAANGDSTQVDMLVRDIYGDNLQAEEDDAANNADGTNPDVEIAKNDTRSRPEKSKKKNILFNTLRPTTLAASFGKMLNKEARMKVRKEDLALSALIMCSMNVAAIAHIHAKQLRVRHILFTGNFLSTSTGLKSANGRKSAQSIHFHARETLSLHKRNTVSMRILSYAVSFWSKNKKQAIFLKHEGCLGALGAMLIGTQLKIPAKQSTYAHL